MSIRTLFSLPARSSGEDFEINPNQQGAQRKRGGLILFCNIENGFSEEEVFFCCDFDVEALAGNE